MPILKDESIKCSYTSPDVQNEMIELLGSIIKTIISEECQNKPFSLIIDETCDIWTEEQVAVIIRYAVDDLKIQERFVGLIKTGSTSDKELEEILNSSIKQLGLSSESFLVAQGYDGAINMSGNVKGVASRVRAKVQRAIYIHCHCHRLNLALEKACSEISEVINCLGR